MKNNSRVLISRTDNLGDVLLTFPACSLIREQYPDATIIFLGSDYTRPLVEACGAVDEFVNWDTIRRLPFRERVARFREINADVILHVFPRREIALMAHLAGIPLRIGTTNRLYHYVFCNRLMKLSRRKSGLHEAQLNIKLLETLDIHRHVDLNDIPSLYKFQPQPDGDDPAVKSDPQRFNLIIHPKSKGNTKEWDIVNYLSLIDLLPEERFKLFLTGTREDGEELRQLKRHPRIHDLTGKQTLRQLINFISRADGIVSVSTGPLHIAAALSKVAVGVYPSLRPMHPGRWAALGPYAVSLAKPGECQKCQTTKHCNCIQEVTPVEVFSNLESLIGKSPRPML